MNTSHVYPSVFTLSACLACSIGTPGESGGAGSGTSTSTGDSTSTATSTESAPSSTATGDVSDSGTSTGSSASSTSTTGAPPDVCTHQAGDLFVSRPFPGEAPSTNPHLEVSRALSLHEGRLAAAWNSYEPPECATPQALDLGQPLPEATGDDGVVALYGPDLKHLQSHVFKGSGMRYVYDIVFTANGNLLVTGFFDDTIDLPSALGVYTGATSWMASDGEFEGFVAAFDAQGVRVPFAHEDGAYHLAASLGAVQPHDIALSPDGDFAVIGRYHGNLGTPGCNFTGGDDRWATFAAFFDGDLLKLKPDGIRCINPIDPAPKERVYGLRAAFAADGSLLVVGDFSAAFKFAGEDFVSPAEDDQDGFVAAWGAGTEEAWAFACRSEVSDQVRDVAVGPDGRVLIAGSIGDAARCSSAPSGASNHQRAFVAAFDAGPTGVQAWRFDRQLAAEPDIDRESHSEFFSVAVDSCGAVVAAGYGAGAIRWEGERDPWDAKEADAQEDLAITKLSADGTPLWGHRWSGAGRDWIEGLAIDEFNTIYAAAKFEGPIDELAWPEPLIPNCAAENVGLLHLSP